MNTNTARCILIYAVPNGFTVHEGEGHSGQLSWDEMLWQIAALTLPYQRISGPKHGLFGMRTPEEWTAMAEDRRRRIAARPPTTMSECIAHLREYVKWYCARGGPMDMALPMKEQPPSVQGAMRALAALDALEEPVDA